MPKMKIKFGSWDEMTALFYVKGLFFLILAIIGSACAGGVKDAAGPPAQPGPDPLNTTYTIEDLAVPLVNGRFNAAAAPGLATRIMATVFGRPLFGDLDHDGDEDAVVVIVYDSGGSGTFYYIAAAINQNGSYRGTAGYLLGDRIIAQFVKFDDGLVQAHYLDRWPDKPMSAPPTVRMEIHLRLVDGKLTPVTADTEEEQEFEGWVTLGHEVQSFLPCSEKTDHWLLGISPALHKIASAYSTTLWRAKIYTPLFMSLAGHIAPAPSEGFGADYSAAFYANRLVQVRPAGNCRDEFIVVASPKPGDLIRSPLKISGQARGTWFFEGDFPLFLKDPKGRIIARGYVTARGQWMTKEFVPFEGTLTFKEPAARGRGTLVFKKDNPTDRPELDDAMELPVRF
jgi:hypothetical protein